MQVSRKREGEREGKGGEEGDEGGQAIRSFSSAQLCVKPKIHPLIHPLLQIKHTEAGTPEAAAELALEAARVVHELAGGVGPRPE
jgi:hypothetical protein